MSEVKVTVLMPAWNAGKYIAEAIHSVLNQSFTDIELVIINDGSTDNTVSVIKQFKDPRIRLLEQPQQGIAVALNYGLREARGNYIARFDADDICFPERIHKQYHLFLNNPEYILTGSDVEYISENGEHLFDFHCTAYTHEEIMSELYYSCPFIHSSVMFRKDVVIKAGGYSADAHIIEDHLLWRQLASSGRFCNIPEPLIRVRFNPQSATIDEKWRGSRFRQLRKKIIAKGNITSAEGNELQAIISKQNIQKIKKGSYYALCGKKFLVNNHQPGKARRYLAKSIRNYPIRLESYALYMLSYLPKGIISWLHKKTRN